MAAITERSWVNKDGTEKKAWRVRFMAGKVERVRQFTTARAAKKFLETVSEERARLVKKGVALDSPTFTEVAEAWLSSRASGSDGSPPLEPMTVVWYRGLLANHILPRLGQFRVGELERGHLKTMRAALLTGPVPQTNSEGTPGGQRRGLGPSTRSRQQSSTECALSRRTVQKILTTVRQILRYALDEELIKSDPSDRLSVRHSQRDKKGVEIHSTDEMRRILSTAHQLTLDLNQTVSKPWQRYYPMLLISVYCGLRISEIRGLDCKDVDFGRGVIRVRQRADAKGRLGSPKSAKGFRDVHYPQILEAELRRVIGDRTEGLVFHTASGRPVDTANFRKRAWQNVQKRAGVRTLNLHSCRHFFASRQIADGVHPKELSVLLGHADEAFTLRVYGHLFQDQETEDKRRKRAEALVLTG